MVFKTRLAPSGSVELEQCGGESMATVTSWISKNASRCGGDACIRDTRITVWGLEVHRRLGRTNAEILQAVSGLTATDLDAAWEYIAANRQEIEQAIQENEAGEEGLID
jgi:uncharacterized protein (DUF433 family)